jgi:hypothetical protein
MNKLLAVFCLVLMVTGLLVFAKKRPDVSLPKEVNEGQQILAGWLDGFVNKTQEQVEKQLGAASDQTTWEFRQKKELVLRYKILDKATLLLYFLDRQVIKASYQLLSE